MAAGEPLAVQLAPLVADMESVAAGQQQLRRDREVWIGVYGVVVWAELP